MKSLTPSRRRQHGAMLFWIVALLILIGAIIGGALVAYWVFTRIDLKLVLDSQPATVTIPEPVNVTAKVLNNLDIVIDDKIRTKVPVNQTVSVPVNDTLNLTADFDANVPIKMTVPVHDTIPIDQALDVDTVLRAEFLGDVHDLHVRGKVPVKAQVPVNLVIPVDKMVKLKFTAPVQAKIKQNLTVPLNMVIDAEIPIKSEMSVPVKSELAGAVTFPKDPTNVIINYADLVLPLRTLRLSTHDGDNEPPPPSPPQAPRGGPTPQTPDLELAPVQESQPVASPGTEKKP